MTNSDNRDNPLRRSPYLAGKLLLAMPTMGDPRFYRAAIFICAHDVNGAMGLVINHVLPGLDLGEMMKQTGLAPKDGNIIRVSQPVFSGGPVETARGFILHSSDFKIPDTVKVSGDIFVTGTVDGLKAIASGAGPQHMRFILGYAGWGAGQLDREMRDNAWLVADADPELVFATDPNRVWDKAMKKIGIDPLMLSGAAGRA